MGKSGSSSGGTQVVQAPRPDIPNEQLLQSSGLWRLHASSPYYSSPWRTMDFAQGYYAPSMQLPTFTQPGAYQPWGMRNTSQPALITSGQYPSGAYGKGSTNPGMGTAAMKPSLQQNPQTPQQGTPATPVQDKTLVRPDNQNPEVPQR